MGVISDVIVTMHAGSTFEEYVVLADYEPVATGEISAKAGDRVNVIQREDTGWMNPCTRTSTWYDLLLQDGG